MASFVIIAIAAATNPDADASFHLVLPYGRAANQRPDDRDAVEGHRDSGQSGDRVLVDSRLQRPR